MATGLSLPSKHRNPSAKLGGNGFGYQNLWGRVTKDDSSFAFLCNQKSPSAVSWGKCFEACL